jgi:hypothetical protein
MFAITFICFREKFYLSGNLIKYVPNCELHFKFSRQNIRNIEINFYAAMDWINLITLF